MILCLSALAFTAAVPVRDCKCKGIALHGRVRVVESHADFDVHVVESHADLHVKVVTSHPNACGEWQFVDSHADFTVRFVDSHEDFSIKYVTSHAGMPR